MAAVAATEVKDTNWLSEQVAAKAKKELSPYQLRIILRRLVKDGTVEREEGRWQFSGVNDPTVKAVIEAVKNGAHEEATKEGTSKAKATARKAPAKKAVAKKTTSRRKKAAEPVEEEEDLDDLDEL